MLKEIVPGILLAMSVACVAVILGLFLPIVGAPVFGILLGLLISSLFKKPVRAVKGLSFAGKQVLQASIVVLGAGLSLSKVVSTGISSLSVMLGTIAAAFITAYGLGKLMKIPLKITSLIGMGTAICGGSAIAAISPIIEAEEKDIAYAISTVFIFNIAAVIIFPLIGHALHMSENSFGLWAGTAINDTSSVVAAGYSYGKEAGAYGTIVKLTRTTMIIPISLLFAFFIFIRKRREHGGAVQYSFIRTFPWFILFFLAASLLNTCGLIGPSLSAGATKTGQLMIVLALSAIGLNADLKKMLATGIRPVILGLAVWFVVAVTSLLVQHFTGQI